MCLTAKREYSFHLNQNRPGAKLIDLQSAEKCICMAAKNGHWV